jgi:hypothetical protein
LVSRGWSFLRLLVVIGLASIGGGRRRWRAVGPVPQALWLVGIFVRIRREQDRRPGGRNPTCAHSSDTRESPVIRGDASART